MIELNWVPRRDNHPFEVTSMWSSEQIRIFLKIIIESDINPNTEMRFNQPVRPDIRKKRFASIYQ